MPVKISAEVKGLKETQRNMTQAVKDLRGTPMLNAMRDATLYVDRDSKKNLVGYESPTVGGVNTGRLRASITPEVTAQGETVQGVVGSNVSYAPYVEFDTRPHWPPLAALEVWAERHHTSAFLVARAISKRGTYGKHFLQKAFDANKDKIEKRIGQAVETIVKVANGG